MPHLTLHYSANLEPPPDAGRLFGDLHAAIAALGKVEVAAFKSRAIRCEAFRVGDGAPQNAFAHLDLRLLGGRTNEEKARIADGVMAVLDRHLASSSGLDLQITLDLLDLDPNAYRKLARKGNTS